MKEIKINESILDIIERYTRKAPVDVRNLAKELDIRIIEKTLPDEESGSIEKSDDQYVITVNSTHSENRKRFTIAHELGHFMLHDRLINNGIFDNKLFRRDKNSRNEKVTNFHETEANIFAANLLMPAGLVFSLIKEEGIDYEEHANLAKKLEVSEQAMQIRLSALKNSQQILHLKSERINEMEDSSYY